MANAQEIMEGISKTFSQTADKFAKRTEDFVSIQKLRGQTLKLERLISTHLMDMGKYVFQDKANWENYPEELVDHCKGIEVLRAEIRGIKEQISILKGGKYCPTCGATVPGNAAFCMSCGVKMEEAEDKTFEKDLEEVEAEVVEEAAEKAAEEDEPKFAE